MTKAKTIGTVRERERESYTLVTESAVLFNSLTHTSNFIEIKRGRNTFIDDIKNDRL